MQVFCQKFESRNESKVPYNKLTYIRYFLLLLIFIDLSFENELLFKILDTTVGKLVVVYIDTVLKNSHGAIIYAKVILVLFSTPTTDYIASLK